VFVPLAFFAFVLAAGPEAATMVYSDQVVACPAKSFISSTVHGGGKRRAGTASVADI
jgi:hypothetical protein